MAGYKLSKKADEDFESIYRYGFTNFGPLQADIYVDGIVERIERLAEHPELYPAVDHVRPGYRYSVYKSHTIYYRKEADYVLIIRILRSQNVRFALDDGQE